MHATGDRSSRLANAPSARQTLYRVPSGRFFTKHYPQSECLAVAGILASKAGTTLILCQRSVEVIRFTTVMRALDRGSVAVRIQRHKDDAHNRAAYDVLTGVQQEKAEGSALEEGVAHAQALAVQCSQRACR